MFASLPLILVPGLACSPRIYALQIPALWRQGPVILANHIRVNTMAGIAKRSDPKAVDSFRRGVIWTSEALASEGIDLVLRHYAHLLPGQLALVGEDASPRPPEVSATEPPPPSAAAAGGKK